MKIQILKCKTCNRIYAACVDRYADAGWFKSVAKGVGGGNAVFETIESDGKVFDGTKANPCCGKTQKQLDKLQPHE